MRILPEEYPLREDSMILVKNSLSLASSNAFIPTFQLKYLQKQRETHKVTSGTKTRTIFARFQGTFHCKTMETRLRKATDSLRGKKERAKILLF